MHADSGYNRQSSVDVLFEKNDLLPDKTTANNSMAAALVTAKWSFEKVKL